MKDGYILTNLVLSFLLVFFNENVSSQNLVPNPSFEDKIDFNSKIPNNWTKCLKNDTPDYFDYSKNKGILVEGNALYNDVEPFEGHSCVGIFCYRVNPLRGTTDIREFIQITLTEPLKRDSLYVVALYLYLDNESNVAINNFNILFAEELIFEKQEQKMYEYRAQIDFRQNYFDNNSWMKIEKIYRASGKEKVIVLGNFKADKGLRIKHIENIKSKELNLKWHLGEKEKAAYYYIDMISVTPQRVEKEIIEPELAEEKPDTSSNRTFEVDKIENDVPVILKNILFEFDEDILLAESYKELDRLFTFMNDNSQLIIEIEGHTDDIGSYEYNIDLSNRRAKAVADYLIQKGIMSERLSWKGYGKTQPITKNESEEGRQLNRRVAFRIIEK